jgi:hypothetical protein
MNARQALSTEAACGPLFAAWIDAIAASQQIRNTPGFACLLDDSGPEAILIIQRSVTVPVVGCRLAAGETTP